MSGRISVYVRVRPPFRTELTEPGYSNVISIEKDEDEQLILIAMPQNEIRHFRFDGVFMPADGQETVYNTCALPLIQNVLNGYNSTLICYGQTGTGKTYTMGILEKVSDIKTAVSPGRESVQTGIVPRGLAFIFNHLYSLEDSWDVKVSFCQIYRESIQDLLAPQQTDLKVREAGDTFFVDGLSLVGVDHLEQAIDVVNRGLENRAMAPTLMNTLSSRSHTILTVRITQFRRSATHYDVDSTIVGSLVLVDLAGSERIKRSKSVGARFDEARSINRSLAALGNVVSAITTDKDHVPFRDVKLTKILANSIGGNSFTAIVGTIGPSSKNHNESLNTLNFAQRCMQVTQHATLNEQVNYRQLCLKQQEKIAELEAALEDDRAEIVARYETIIKELLKKAAQHDPQLQNSMQHALRGISSIQTPIQSQHFDSLANGAFPIQVTSDAIAAMYNILCSIHQVTSQPLKEDYSRVNARSPQRAKGKNRQKKGIGLKMNHPKLSDFADDEALVNYAAELRSSIIGQIKFFDQLLREKEEVVQECLKQQRTPVSHHHSTPPSTHGRTASFTGVERDEHERDVRSWGTVLKYLLAANTKMKAEIEQLRMGGGGRAPPVPEPALMPQTAIQTLELFTPETRSKLRGDQSTPPLVLD